MSEVESKLSRRALLRQAATAVGVLGAAAAAASGSVVAQAPPAGAPAQPARKQTKQEATYQDQPNGPQQCGLCVHFRPPNDCEVIQGPVQANGWCRNFRSRA
jgi:hypothetical protein